MEKFYVEYSWDRESPDFSTLVGKVFTKVENNGNEEIVFYCNDGSIYRQVYYPDCCASCSVEEIHGDLSDLENTPILMAEEVKSSDPSPEIFAERKATYEKEKSEFKPKYEGHAFYDWKSPENNYGAESETWTFYKLATIKGSVTIRWYGSSNGYYSETATFEKVQ